MITHIPLVAGNLWWPRNNYTCTKILLGVLMQAVLKQNSFVINICIVYIKINFVHLVDIKSLLISWQLYERVPHVLVTPGVPGLRGSCAALAEEQVRITTVGLHLYVKTRGEGLTRQGELEDVNMWREGGREEGRERERERENYYPCRIHQRGHPRNYDL